MGATTWEGKKEAMRRREGGKEGRGEMRDEADLTEAARENFASLPAQPQFAHQRPDLMVERRREAEASKPELFSMNGEVMHDVLSSLF